jgi:PAS domain S-box-containing protein
MEHAVDAYLLHDATGRFLDVNRRACESLGYSREELLKLSASDVTSLGETEAQGIWNQLQAGSTVTVKDFHRRKDGTRFPVEIRLGSFDVDGQKLVLGLARDITERKRAEEVLQGISSRESGSHQKRVFRDLAIIFALSAIVFTIGHLYDVFDPIFLYFAYKNNQLNSDLDEVVATMAFFGFAMMIFAYRRFKENRAEVLTQTQISEALGVLHTEMEAKVRQRTADLVQTNEDLRNEIVERHRIEAIIRQFPAIIETSDDAIISKTLGGIITSWNPAAERMFGYTAPEIIGMPVTVLFPPDRIQEEEEILARIAAGERLTHYETVRVRKDGRRLEVSATISPIKDATGKITGASKIVRDVTERKRAERSLIESENKFHSLFDEAIDAIFILREGVFVDCNVKGLELFGVTHDQLIGQSPSLFAPPAQPDGSHSGEKAAEKLQAALAGEPQLFEWVHRRPNGTTVHSEVRLSRFDQNGEPYLQAIARDITERKLAQEQIAEQAALIDKASDAILVRELEGEIQFWNHGAERIYGWPREEAIGRNVKDLFYTDTSKFAEANASTISQGEWNGELQHQTLNRGQITVQAHWTLIRTNEGQPKSILAINTDITDRKKIESQFLRAQRMESIGTLAGGIAHDLNNILAPIMMSVEVLKSYVNDPEARDILGTLEVSAQRGSDIVRQVLSFARGMEGQRTEVQPKHLLNDLVSIIKDTFPKDVRLKFSIPTDTWTISGDPTQLHQILLNLCVNARDAMPDGGSLTVAAENCVLDDQYAAMHIEAKAGRYVIISVTDSGTGIPPAILEKIFEPFFTTKDLNKGTGLGLSTVIAIVKSHQGFVNVYSEPGKGTTFKVYLPAMEGSPEGQEQEPEVVSLPRGNGETILVVDDEASIRTITSQTLVAFGYRVLAAMDGAEAVAVFAEHKHEIALVLTDMMMPVMDGPAIIHALMRINPTIKIIAASGLNSNGGLAKVSNASVKHFLTKPYTAGTLLKTIRAILDET